jgi:hypothetical protein
MARLLPILMFFLMLIPAQAAPRPDDPLAMIKTIYKKFEAAAPEPEQDIYSRRLQRLIDADRKSTPDGDVGALDFDVFVNGNNWELANVRVELLSRDATRAQVRSTFESFKKPQEILFSFVREGGHWRIDEIQSLKSIRWTMSKILTGARDAFPDHKR